MKGIKMSDCKFYMNPEAQTVVCVIPNTKYMVLDFIRDNFIFSDIDIYDSINFEGERLTEALKMPNSFVGKARCVPEDEWNEELGKMIAYSRAKDKCYKSFFKRANMFVQTVDRRLGDMIEMFNDFGLKLDAKKEALEAKIDEKLNKKE